MKCTVLAAHLKRALTGCAGAVSNDIIGHPELAYAHIKVSDEKMTLTALDGFRMVRYELAAVAKPLCEIEDGETCVYPNAMLSAMRTARGLAEVASDGRELRVKTDVEITLALPNPPIKFTDVDGIWPDRNRSKVRIAVNPKLLIEAVRALDTDMAMVLEVPTEPGRAIEIRGTGSGFSTRGLVLPIRMADWGESNGRDA